MKDVAAFYRLRESQKDEAGASSFLVAEVETGVEGQRELVGCVGLGELDDPSSPLFLSL